MLSSDEAEAKRELRAPNKALFSLNDHGANQWVTLLSICPVSDALCVFPLVHASFKSSCHDRDHFHLYYIQSRTAPLPLGGDHLGCIDCALDNTEVAFVSGLQCPKMDSAQNGSG